VGFDMWRVAQLQVRYDGGARRGSGYLVKPGVILTAAHVLADVTGVSVAIALDQPEVVRVEASSWVLDPLEEDGTDLAVLRIPPEACRDCRPVEFARLGDVSATLPAGACGFPRYKAREDGRTDFDSHDVTRSVIRESVHVVGRLHLGSNFRLRSLQMVLDHAGPLETGVDEPSPWEGMSGAAIWVDDHIVGVVTEHHRAEGSGSLTARRIDSLYAAPSGAAFAELLQAMELPEVASGLADAVTRHGEHTLLTTSEHEALVALLMAAPTPNNLAALHRRASFGVARQRPFRGDMLACVQELMGLTDPHALLGFVAGIAVQAGDRTRTELDRWLGLVSERLHLEHFPLEVLAASVERSGLLVAMIPETNRVSFYVQVWHQLGNQLRSVSWSDQALSTMGLADHIDEVLQVILGDVDKDNSRPMIQFSLQREMMDFPVEALPLKSRKAAPLGAEFPVVVRRPLDDRNVDATRSERWAVVEVSTSYHKKVIAWADSDDTKIWSKIKAKERILCVVSARPVTWTDGFISNLLGSEVPVAVWLHSQSTNRDYTEDFEGLLKGFGLAYLPERVRSYRSEYINIEGGQQQFGNNLVLLWDDPNKPATLELDYLPKGVTTVD
jgi:hypothetical protein